MTKLQLVATVLVSLTACGKKTDGGESRAGDAEIIAKLSAMKAKVCACTDAACTQALLPDYSKLATSFPPGAMSAADQKQVDDLTNAITKCGEKFAGGGSAAPAAKIDLVGQMTDFKNRMCGCHDHACLDGIKADFQKFNDALQASPQAKQDLPPQISDLIAGFTECATKLDAELKQ